MPATRGTTNTNVRGSAANRRARKQFLLDTFGDGEKAPCALCRRMLDFATVTVGRIIAGCHGGTYRRDNIQPECSDCASRLGGALRSNRIPDLAGVV